MAANINDVLTNTSSGVRPVSTTVSTLRNLGGTTLACADLTGWPTDAPVHFVTYQVDGQNAVVAGTQTDWKGIVSGSDINNLTVTGGSDAGNSVGDIVELLPTAAWGSDLFDGLTETLNQTDGSLKDGVVDTDNLVDDAVTTSKVSDAAITPEKRSGGFYIGLLPGSTFGTTGNKAITGLGFKPKLVRFMMTPGTNGGVATPSYGAMTSVSQYWASYWASQSPTAGRLSGYDGCIASMASATVISMKASYVSMDADGFTINVSTASSANDVSYEAYA